MLRRSQGRGRFPGCWELPGGKPDPDETIDATARREAREESGLSVTITGVAGVGEGNIAGVHVALLILESRTRGTKVTLSDEHDDFRWLPLEQIASLKLRPGFGQFFADYVVRSKRRPPEQTSPSGHFKAL